MPDLSTYITKSFNHGRLLILVQDQTLESRPESSQQFANLFQLLPFSTLSVMPGEYILLIVFLAVSIFFVFRRSFSRPLPPGPSIFSAVITLLQRRQGNLDATALIDNSRLRYGSVFSFFFGFTRILVSSNHIDIAQINNFPRPSSLTSAFAEAFPGGIFAMNPSQHSIARAHISANFNHDYLRSVQSRLPVIVNQLVARLDSVGNAVVDISEELSLTTLRVFLSVAFELNPDSDTCLHLTKAINNVLMKMVIYLALQPSRCLPSMLGILNSLRAARQHLDDICEPLLDRLSAKDSGEQKNLIALLFDTQKNRKEAISFLSEMALSGTQTTSQTLVWCLFEMFKKPQTLSMVCEELDARASSLTDEDVLQVDDVMSLQYTRWVWKETLRLHPVNAGISRKATKDITLKGSGTHVKKGTNMMAFVYGMHTDEKLWERPKEFWPERWSKDTGAGKYMPFSRGEWSCIGKFLAEFEGPFLLAELLRRFELHLACSVDEVQNCSRMVETPRTRSKPNGNFDRGLPVLVKRRMSSVTT